MPFKKPAINKIKHVDKSRSTQNKYVEDNQNITNLLEWVGKCNYLTDIYVFKAISYTSKFSNSDISFCTFCITGKKKDSDWLNQVKRYPVL